MKKKRKTKLIGIIIFILLLLIEISGINFDNIYNSILPNKADEIIEDNINDVELAESDLHVYYIDVGQADAILIQNKKENMLIDAGNNADGDKLVSFLKSKNITKFKYVVGTHPHEDHIGGLDNIIKSFDVENVLLPNAYTTTQTFEDVLDAIDKRNLSITVPKIGSKLTLGNANIKILYTGEDKKDLNDTSIVLRLEFGVNSFLFTGDAGVGVEKQILNENIKADVYKVSHHGSNSGNSSSFLDKVNPTYAIISCEKNNIYGHPNKETLDRLTKRKIKIYRTDELGTIIVTSNGKNIKITSLKTDTNGG